MFILKADNLMMEVGGKTLFKNASVGWVISEHRHAVIKNELNRLTNLLNENPHDEKILSKYNSQLQNYLDCNGYEWEIEVEKVLTQLNVPSEIWDNPFSSLSGGQKTRVKLAKIMINSSKLILLDEPTI